jgi:hypothetical protein
MSRSLLWILGALVALAVVLSVGALRLTAVPEIPLLAATPEAVAARANDESGVGLCPWREPETDLKRFFPTATGHRDETLVLSRHRAEIASRLGHPTTGEDNALQIHRVFRGPESLGAIVTRRVRGESGVIELVLAVDDAGNVLGAKLQRLREPDDVARQLQSDAFLGAFRGKTARSDWQLGKAFPSVSAAARSSAAALLDGTHTVLVLLDVGSRLASSGHSHP